MYADPILDPMGGIIREAREDSDVAALVSARVRGGQAAPGDRLGPGQYQAFVVIAALSVPPHPTLPISFAEYSVSAYGVTPQNAWAVWASLVKAFHKVGPRTKSNDQIFYQSIVATGGEQDFDPDTGQPLVRGTIRLPVALVAVAGS